MCARDADALALSIRGYKKLAVLDDRDRPLRNLIRLGKVGIEVIFAVEYRLAIDRRIDGGAEANGFFNRLLVSTGRAPGSAKQVGQTCEFASSPKLVGQEQKILVLVFSWQCTSRPITVSNINLTF